MSGGEEEKIPAVSNEKKMLKIVSQRHTGWTELISVFAEEKNEGKEVGESFEIDTLKIQSKPIKLAWFLSRNGFFLHFILFLYLT